MVMRSGGVAPSAAGRAIGAGGRSPAARVIRVKRFSILLLKRRVTCPGARSSTASWIGEDSSTIAWGDTGDTVSSTSEADSSKAAWEAGRDERVTGRSAPVVQHQVDGVFVILLLATLHPDHVEDHVVAALQQCLICWPLEGEGEDRLSDKLPHRHL